MTPDGYLYVVFDKNEGIHKAYSLYENAIWLKGEIDKTKDGPARIEVYQYIRPLPRNPLKFNDDLKMLFDLIDEEKLDDARQLLEELREEFLNDPELTRASALIKFLDGE